MKINESDCLCTKLNGAIAIKALKRFVADRDTGKWKEYSKIKPSTGNKVAIIGSGPAGLTAGYYLAKSGHSVTVFEAKNEPGGMMRVGIPDYRLPKDILESEIEEIKKVGVEIKLNSKITSIDQLQSKGFKAVFLSLGSHSSRKLNIEGESNPGVIDCLDFLIKINSGSPVKVGSSVSVIGGGNAAIDCARSTIRSGAKQVNIIYRRTRSEMLASDEEIKAASGEGVKFTFLASPVKITENNGKLNLTCNNMELGDVDSSGRRRPIPIKGSEFTVKNDLIINATGLMSNVPDQLKVEKNSDNAIKVDLDTLATSRPGIWAGGDVVSGPASVIEAIAAGRKAAVSIDKFMGGDGIIDEKLTKVQRKIVSAQNGQRSDSVRVEMSSLPFEKRKGNFEEVEPGLDEKSAETEGQRCMQCGISAACRQACPAGINVPLYTYLISKGLYDDALAVIREKVPFPKILGRVCFHPCEDACNGCGRCVPYCPVNVISRDGQTRAMTINNEECVECGVCLRSKSCPTSAIIDDVPAWPRSVRSSFSNPLVLHKETRVPGRGTEECKTNEVTGQFRRGFVGITAELGRPGVGVRFGDIEKVAQAMASAGVVFAHNNPVTFQMVDKSTGKLNPEVINEKVLSAMIESTTPLKNVKNVIKALRDVKSKIDTVFSVTISTRLEEDGSAPCLKELDELKVPLYINGKTNLGLGRPLFKED